MNEQLEDRPMAEPIELPEKLSRRCEAAVWLLRIGFTLVPIAIGLWAWSEMGWLYGLLAWLMAIFVGMIVLSKLKLAHIPFSQHELSHSTYTILKWFVIKNICR
ncbi:hypothetical protein [Hydrogenimonas sp.]